MTLTSGKIPALVLPSSSVLRTAADVEADIRGVNNKIEVHMNFIRAASRSTSRIPGINVDRLAADGRGPELDRLRTRLSELKLELSKIKVSQEG